MILKLHLHIAVSNWLCRFTVIEVEDKRDISICYRVVNCRPGQFSCVLCGREKIVIIPQKNPKNASLVMFHGRMI